MHAPEVMHGRLSAVYHDDSPLFAGIPQGFQVVRYHSLCVTEPLPEDLEAIAWTADGVVMGAGPPHAADVGRPVPPRVDLHRLGPPPARQLPRPDRRRDARQAHAAHAAGHERRRPERVVAPAAPAPAPAGRAHRPAVRPRAGLRQPLRRPPATPSGSTAARSTSARASRSWAPAAARSARSSPTTSTTGSVKVARGVSSEVHEESIFDYLSREMKRLRYLSDDLPFDFNCGFVGYFGYELKADCEGDLAARVLDARRRLRLRRPADRLRPLREVRPTCSA